MTGNDLALVADGLVALLLAVVIGYAVVLNRRLRDWRAQSAEMERQMATLNATLVRAEVAVNTLKGVCKDDGAALDAAQRKAQSLRDDLAFLVERGGSLADRLEQAVRAGLHATSPAAAPPSEPAARPADRGGGATSAPASDRAMSNAERELLKALEGMR
jgi:hypothetical protein